MNLTSLPAVSVLLAGLSSLSAEPGRVKDKPSPARDVKRLIEEFSVRDLNGNGRLGRDEFSSARTLSATRRFRRVDQDRNRTISLSEFAGYRGVRLPRGARPLIDQAKKEFRNLDGNRDGTVSLEEIAAVTTFPDGKALDDYFSMLDKDSSGGISLDEWRAGNNYPKLSDPTGFGRYIGLTLEAAENLAQSEGRSSRVVRIDGEWMAVTMDYRPDRLNFSIDGGVVTEVTTG